MTPAVGTPDTLLPPPSHPYARKRNGSRSAGGTRAAAHGARAEVQLQVAWCTTRQWTPRGTAQSPWQRQHKPMPGTLKAQGAVRHGVGRGAGRGKGPMPHMLRTHAQACSRAAKDAPASHSAHLRCPGERRVHARARRTALTSKQRDRLHTVHAGAACSRTCGRPTVVTTTPARLAHIAAQPTPASQHEEGGETPTPARCIIDVQSSGCLPRSPPRHAATGLHPSTARAGDVAAPAQRQAHWVARTMRRTYDCNGVCLVPPPPTGVAITGAALGSPAPARAPHGASTRQILFRGVGFRTAR